MKQKYTITIADMELNVISEAPTEDIEKVVGVLDRRVRSLLLKNNNCSKTEATLLCALDFCADKLQMKEVIENLVSDLEEQKEKNAVLEEKLSLLEKNIEKTEKECARLQAENKRLMFNGQVYKQEAPEKTEPAKAESNQTAEAPADNNSPKGRSRVGEMFDLLTFTDI
ncbi:MAG: cell division protein ZapA [Ruminococcaceae bacterium]|nr:cell division protein ZapA [Oscillospiraceae bacterium]